MKISIVTVCFNSSKTIKATLNSVANQDYSNIEHIIIDGESSDNTLDIVRDYNHVAKVICEKDTGIYNAMNKGLKQCTGEIVGILNSDDRFKDEYVIEKIANAFKDKEIDALVGDVQFVESLTSDRVLRYYSSDLWRPDRFQYGFMPAHPSFYAKRELFSKYGYYKEDYKIAADFDLLLRFLLIHELRYYYLQEPLVNMLPGGVSTKNFRMKYILNKEVIRSCKENGVSTNYLKMLYRLYVKFINR